MANQYTIYLQNQSDSDQTFWCFLQKPDQLVAEPGVYANSAARLKIRSNSPATDTFVIPAQFIVAVDSSNKAVGLNVKVDSTNSLPADLGTGFQAGFSTDNSEPTLTKSGAAPSTDSLSILVNNFNTGECITNKWFPSVSFGIKTEDYFIGMSWAPNPGQTRVIKPKLAFYVAVGSYGTNPLASFADFSNTAQSLGLSDFSQGSATVIYQQDGTWKLNRGGPN